MRLTAFVSFFAAAALHAVGTNFSAGAMSPRSAHDLFRNVEVLRLRLEIGPRELDNLRATPVNTSAER
jgi:hypothetical protein